MPEPIPAPSLKPVAPPAPRLCRCGNVATILVTWGKGVIAYCDACEPEGQ